MGKERGQTMEGMWQAAEIPGIRLEQKLLFTVMKGLSKKVSNIK